MKIGILTYHRSNNYGALLQGLALREVLVRLGHHVTFIDYWPSYHRHMYALFSITWLMFLKGTKCKLNYIKRCFNYYASRKARKEKFDLFITKQIEPYTSSTNETYDVIVHGSDQIWRKQPEIYKYNPVYFGKHKIKAKKKVSYAASMGILPKKEYDKTIIKGYLSNLDHISVRESSLQRMLYDQGFSNVFLNLDPTLLLPMDYWVNQFELKSDNDSYALYYKIQDSFDMIELHRYTKSRGLKLIVIHSQARCAETKENITTADPQRFLQLIYGAKMVFTSSFHGLAFSLIFHKPFYASFTKNSDRASSLMKLCGLDDHLLVPYSMIPSYGDAINYLGVDNVLNELKDLSIKNLEKSVSFKNEEE